MEPREEFLLLSFEVALQGVESGDGGPFGAVIVRGDDVLSSAHNQVVATNDPTAHAEIGAIRAACALLGSFQLDDCDLYSSCEPCPMCLGAIYWARPERVFIACDRNDAAEAGFDDAFIYDELCGNNFADRKVSISILLRDEGLKVFKNWTAKPDKIEY